jgi:hypothetical protein
VGGESVPATFRLRPEGIAIWINLLAFQAGLQQKSPSGLLKDRAVKRVSGAGPDACGRDSAARTAFRLEFLYRIFTLRLYIR